MSAVIDVRGLWRIYETAAGHTTALRGVSLQVARGEFLAIMGPSGSGKSTLMNILGCLDRPTAGSYRLEGVEVSELTEDDLAHVRSSRLGFVFQSFNLLPRATVLRNVMLPLVYSDAPARDRELAAWRALRSVGLPEEHYLHRSNELSGGQMQRVAIARALVNDPAIILADEPTGNLDTATGEMVMRTFQRMQRRGKTIILITHDPEVAAWADRTVHIRDGRLFSDEEERAYLADLARREGASGEKDPGEKDPGEKDGPAAGPSPAAPAAPKNRSRLLGVPCL
ncbi:ABC transporter ATP-binding protein [Olsenella uli]|uniref:ABC transporter ATP-binding protein n=1 Tax=Olsenella uli TaxID=133926 RepID=UPI001959CC87|nr:ABC transporter ATP-binding protein [Olsenella uli]MBM6816217.1 ABC transporter ATP-binding protein [Olsenella uli]